MSGKEKVDTDFSGLEIHAWLVFQRRLREAAREARKKARHHSNILVGAAALALRASGMFVVLSGCNDKQQRGRKEDGVPRRCAEAQIDDEAKSSRGNNRILRIIGFVIIGTHQPDDWSGTDLGVLLPCGYCRRDVFAPGIERGQILPYTRLILINPDVKRRPVQMTVQQLLQLCNGHHRNSNS